MQVLVDSREFERVGRWEVGGGSGAECGRRSGGGGGRACPAPAHPGHPVTTADATHNCTTDQLRRWWRVPVPVCQLRCGADVL